MNLPTSSPAARRLRFSPKVLLLAALALALAFKLLGRRVSVMECVGDA